MLSWQSGTLAILSSIVAFHLCAEDCCCPPPPCPPPECVDPCTVVYYDPCEGPLFVIRRQLFIHAEFLYWSIKEGALDFANRMDETPTTPTTFAMGKYHAAEYDWRPGFRVALSWYNEPKYWEVTGQYTWFHDKGSDHVHKPDDPNLFLNPTWNTINGGIGALPFLEATSNIHVHYNLGDLYIARVFDPNPHLRMRVYGGATISYIKQHWNIRYSDFDNNFDFIKTKWRFFGGGLRLGTTFDWFWCYQFYLTGRVSFAGLIGTYKNDAEQFVQINQLVRDTHYHDHRFAFHTQFLLGPSWQRPCECWSAEIFVGYEFNIWWNLQEVYRTGVASAPQLPKETNLATGLFGLQGLTVRATIGF